MVFSVMRHLRKKNYAELNVEISKQKNLYVVETEIRVKEIILLEDKLQKVLGVLSGASKEEYHLILI